MERLLTTRRVTLVGLLSLALVGGGAAIASAAETGREGFARYDDPNYCSKYLAEHGDTSLPAAANRRCIIAIASTYVELEQNTLPPEKMLLADDISRHQLGTPPNYAAGNAAKVRAANSHSVIAAIKNRQWTVDGNTAWIAYDGYLKAAPEKPSFFVAERFTIEKGLIREIMIPGVRNTQAKPAQ